MLPQYVLITTSEILVSATGLEWSFTQAPVSMKGVMMAAFLMTNAVGDLLTGLLFNGIGKHVTTVQMFLVFAGLMFVSGVVFVCVAVSYTPPQLLKPMSDDDQMGGSAASPGDSKHAPLATEISMHGLEGGGSPQPADTP